MFVWVQVPLWVLLLTFKLTTMITEDYVSFEVAKLLKEKDFETHYTYTNMVYRNPNNPNEKEELIPNHYKKTRGDVNEILAPTHQMALKWLREIHKLCIVIEPVVSDDDGDAGYLWSFRILRHIIYCCPSVFESYVEATEEAIKYSLNLILYGCYI